MSGWRWTHSAATFSSSATAAADRLKILVWDRSGFWVLYKRLERGTFTWPADARDGPLEMRSADVLLLLSGVDLTHTRRRRWYERVA